MLRLPRSSLETIHRDAQARYPAEACGVLLGRDEEGVRAVRRAVPCANATPGGRADRYAIDPRDLLRLQREARAGGEAIVGFYHSHPDHPGRPSATDLAEAHWPGCAYVITAVRAGRAAETRAFLLLGPVGAEGKRFEEEALVVDDGG